MKQQLPNILTLNEILAPAGLGGYAVGSFSPRYTPVIEPVLRAGENCRAPLIVQISQKEFNRAGITPGEFAAVFYETMFAKKITIPVALHLDHTWDFDIIQAAIESGFTSVMIDASAHSFVDNVALTKEVVSLAHTHGVSVEAELGKIATTDALETDSDQELLTDPDEARVFVEATEVDALAVSVGTAHGVYLVKKPKIDFERIAAIRAKTNAFLVLHGGSGIPAEMLRRAISLTGGGVSKVNIATDIELALLEALGKKERPTNAEMKCLLTPDNQPARLAVENTVAVKVINFLGSQGRAVDYKQYISGKNERF